MIARAKEKKRKIENHGDDITVKMPKVVVKTCYGRFKLSDEAIKLYEQLSGGICRLREHALKRHDPHLVQVVEQLGDRANPFMSTKLKIVVIPGDRYYIHEYDGVETVWTPSNMDWIVIDE